VPVLVILYFLRANVQNFFGVKFPWAWGK
jgi:hypothetical protein